MSATIVSGEKVSYFEYQFDIFTFYHKLHINYYKNEVYMLNPNRVGGGAESATASLFASVILL